MVPWSPESFLLELIRTGHSNRDKTVSFVDLIWVDRCVKHQTGCRGFHTKLVRVAARGGVGFVQQAWGAMGWSGVLLICLIESHEASRVPSEP